MATTLNDIMGLSNDNVDLVQKATTGLQTGMKLAQEKQNIEQQKIQMEQMEDQLEQQKFTKAMNNMGTLARARPEIAKRMVPRIQEQLRAAGIAVDASVLDLMASDDAYKNRFMAITKVASGLANDPKSRQEALQALTDIGSFDKGLSMLEGQNKLETQVDVAQARADAMKEVAGLNAKSKQDAEERRMDETERRKEDNIRKDVSAISGDFQKRQEQFSNINAAVQGGDTRQVTMILSQIARNVGGEKGALSDNDVARVFPADYATTLNQLYAKLGQEGKISASLKKSLMNLVEVAETNANKYYMQNLDTKKKYYSKGQYESLMRAGGAGENIFSSAEALAKAQEQAPPLKEIDDAARRGIDKMKQAGRSKEDINKALKNRGYRGI